MLAIYYFVSHKKIQPILNTHPSTQQPALAKTKSKCYIANNSPHIFNVIILPFKKLNGAKKDYGEVLKMRLEEFMENDSLLLNVCYDDTFEYTGVFDENFRHQYIRDNNADAVIYGTYSVGKKEEDYVSVNISLRTDWGKISKNSELKATTLPDFSKGSLQGDIDYIVTFFSALVAARLGSTICGGFPEVEVIDEQNEKNRALINCESLKANSRKYLDKLTKNKYFQKYYDADTYKYIGQLNVINGDLVQAARSFSKAYSMDSLNAQIVLLYAEYRIHLLKLEHKNQTQKSALLIPRTTELFERAFQLDPTDESILFALAAWHYTVTKDLKRAQEVCHSIGEPTDIIYIELLTNLRDKIDYELQNPGAN